MSSVKSIRITFIKILKTVQIIYFLSRIKNYFSLTNEICNVLNLKLYMFSSEYQITKQSL